MKERCCLVCLSDSGAYGGRVADPCCRTYVQRSAVPLLLPRSTLGLHIDCDTGRRRMQRRLRSTTISSPHRACLHGAPRRLRRAGGDSRRWHLSSDNRRAHRRSRRSNGSRNNRPRGYRRGSARHRGPYRDNVHARFATRASLAFVSLHSSRLATEPPGLGMRGIHGEDDGRPLQRRPPQLRGREDGSLSGCGGGDLPGHRWCSSGGAPGGRAAEGGRTFPYAGGCALATWSAHALFTVQPARQQGKIGSSPPGRERPLSRTLRPPRPVA